MRFITFDVETHPIKPGCTTPQLVCLATAESDDVRVYDRADGTKVFWALISDPNVTLIGHYIFFDLGVMAAEDADLLPHIFDAIDAGRVRCTKLRQMMIDNAEGKLKFIFDEETNEYKKQNYSLAALIARYTGRDIRFLKTADDAWRLRYNELDGVAIADYPADALSYVQGDVKDTQLVFDAQTAYCEPKGLPGGRAGEIGQVQAAWALYLAGTWGVRTDPEAVAKLKAEVTADYNAQVALAKRWKLVRGAGTRDLKAIKTAVKAWYDARQRPLQWTSGGKKGQPDISTCREQLVEVECPCGKGFAACACKDAPETDGIHRGLWAVAEVVRLSKLLSTYIRALERGVKVPLCPAYNSIIETYRTSCSQGMKIDGVPMGVNIQNPPRKHGVRECFVPRPGSVFAFCDYDTLEMRTLAQVCIDLFGYSDIAEAIRAERDLHLDLAADMMEISYEDAEARFDAGDEEVKENRQGSKIANYGDAGGMSAKTFVDYAKGFGMIITLAHARKLHAAFRSKWSEMPRYFDYVSSLMTDGNKADRIEFPRSGLMRGDVTYTATANGFFQHLAAMGAKAAMYKVSRECYVEPESPLYGCRPWGFMHDEIAIEIPYTGTRASAAALRLQAVMIEQMRAWCPDVPISATACMSRKWYKGAKAVFVEGIMVPCKPVKVDGKTIWVEDSGEEARTAA